ncbi:GNAT family N-acetyltransferase [Cetobacterium sp.]|uniref:GNAT family N-acetyltransferase n=1 Tax=Cetobacterium sp. TaxID=2071632 RepID=UPI003EE61BA1
MELKIIVSYKIEMLFVSDDFRGKGIGKQLINFVISNFNVKYVDVNEQNPEGTAFYEYMGFSVFKRSEFDDHGNPYPILHMKLNK